MRGLVIEKAQRRQTHGVGQMQNRIFSVDNPKAAKAQSFGWLNGIHYMAPARLAGVGNLCGNASLGCINLCLGEHSGAAIYYLSLIHI
jgi:hypothetical protein